MALPSTRSLKAGMWMVLATGGCLIMAMIGLAVHVVALGAAFLVLMIPCGIAAFIVMMRGYNKANAEIDQIMREQTSLKDRYLRG